MSWDFHPFNLIMSNNNVKIIDWVDASSGDIRADLFRHTCCTHNLR